MKKNIFILLIIPFVISFLGIITFNIAFTVTESDILGIEWDYDDVEAFKISDSKYRLDAERVIDEGAALLEGNNLVWSVANKDSTDTRVIAEIIYENNSYYLKAISEGSVIIKCSNEKGNVFRQMEAVIYLNGAILINPIISNSQSNIDDTIYYGLYDLEDNKKVNAQIDLSIKCVPNEISSSIELANKSDNIEFDYDKQIITINSSGDAYIELASNTNMANSQRFSFNVVDEGVNVYSYDDLMYCTNKSTDGEIIVLRKSFESLQNTYQMNSGGDVMIVDGVPIKKSNNIDLFGKYNFVSKKFDFSNDILSFETTYNDNYIKEWNEFAKANSGYKTLTNEFKVGLRIQKDFYGNGYTINLHNLTFPYGIIEQVLDDGSIVELPYVTSDNLFQGPLQFYTLGDPNNMPLITLHGQDNVGAYIDGDDITINDLNIKNCDYKNSFSNLDTVGTVVEVNGDDNIIKNSRLSNGKNVLRSFSSMNLTVDNSLLSNARNFLFTTGSNEYIKNDSNSRYSFITTNNGTITSNINDYLKGIGDEELNDYIGALYTDTYKMKSVLTSIQDALNNKKEVEGQFKGSTIINNTLFYRSGVSSISLDTMFNGPFLYSATPSLITSIFDIVEYEGRKLIPITPTNVSGTSYPVKVEITGDTRFYDYKSQDEMDLSGLIDENISELASSFSSFDPAASEFDRLITIDDIFPIKKELYKNAELYNGSLCTPIAYYGGGANLSVVDFSNCDSKSYFDERISINWVDNYLNQSSTSRFGKIRDMMVKTVTITTGIENFKFTCYENSGYLYNETPNITILQNNLKEAI